jgi:hypothetical protein
VFTLVTVESSVRQEGVQQCPGLGWGEVARRTSAAEIIGVAVLLVVPVFLYAALTEELILRGYLQRNVVSAAALAGGRRTGRPLHPFRFLVGVAPTLSRLFIFFTFGSS